MHKARSYKGADVQGEGLPWLRCGPPSSATHIAMGSLGLGAQGGQNEPPTPQGLSMLPIPPPAPKWMGGRARLDLALFLSARSICSSFLQGAGGEGELGWFWQFFGWVLCVFWGFVCLFGLNGFSVFAAGELPGGCGGVGVWGSCAIKGSLCSSSFAVKCKRVHVLQI